MTTAEQHLQRLREFCLMLPEAQEVEMLGHPVFRVATNTFAQFEDDVGRPVVVVKLTSELQASMLDRDGYEIAPETGEHGWTQVRLGDEPEWSEIDHLVIDSYRGQAPGHLLDLLDALLAADTPVSVDEAVSAGGDDEPDESSTDDLGGEEAASGAAPSAPIDAEVDVEIGLVQVITFRTSSYDEVLALVDEWLAATEGARASGRALHCRDLDESGVYWQIVEFESAEAAEKNNDLPETAAFVAAVSALCEERPTFTTLEPIRDQKF